MERLVSIIDYILILCGLGIFIFNAIHGEFLADGTFILLIALLMKFGKATERRFIHFLTYSASAMIFVGVLKQTLQINTVQSFDSNIMGTLFIICIVIGIIFAVFLRYSSYLLTFIWSSFILGVFYNGIKEHGLIKFFSHLWVEEIIFPTYEKYFSLFLFFYLFSFVVLSMNLIANKKFVMGIVGFFHLYAPNKGFLQALQ